MYERLNDEVIELEQVIKPLKFLQPLNLEEERSRFLNNPNTNPEFIYSSLPKHYDSSHIEEKLNSIQIPHSHPLAREYANKIESMKRQHKIILGVGEGEIVKEESSQLYGEPSEELVKKAHETLEESIHNSNDTKRLSAQDLQKSLTHTLRSIGLNEWEVNLTDKEQTTVYGSDKVIEVCKNREFSELERDRLSVHEIGVHALRAHNGYEQPFKILSTGLEGYLPTEEGLASYFEELCGISSIEQMQEYAKRVLAVDSVVKNYDFKNTHELLRQYTSNDEDAFRLALRAHRGGGFIKDHVYLKGYYDVKEFHQNGGHLDDLFIGKIGLDDVDNMNNLVQKGVLRSAQISPQYILDKFSSN